MIDVVQVPEGISAEATYDGWCATSRESGEGLSPFRSKEDALELSYFVLHEVTVLGDER